MKKAWFILLSCLLLVACQPQQSYQLKSPDKQLQLNISNTGQKLMLSVTFQGDTLLSESPLGIDFKDFDPSDLQVMSWKKSVKDTVWTTVNGKNPKVRNHYHQLSLELKATAGNYPTFGIVLRAYNDGFAYRYYLPEQEFGDGIVLEKEFTQLNFNEDFTWWAYNGEHHNVGPLELSQSSQKTIRLPMVAKLREDRYLGIHQAEIIQEAPISLQVNASGDGLLMNKTTETIVAPYHTSWRAFLLGEKPGDLIESNLIVNLNPPSQIKDPSWIKPGRAMWDWRVWGYTTADGYTYGLNTESHKRFIDFASENNIQYLLMDADWYGAEFSETSDPTDSREGIDIEENMRYAKERGVGIILYLNDIGAKKFGLERVIKQFAEWGAAGVKYGFMTGSSQAKVVHTRSVVELCAKYKLMVNFHDNPIPPSGDRRTWPNLVTKEFGHSQADAKRSYFPETAVTAPFVNMMAGPLDMCDCWFDLNTSVSRVKVFEVIPGTVAAEVAKLVVNYSGWKILPDAPEEYLKKEDLFNCIRQMPAEFDGFKVLDGAIGEFIVVARPAGNDWFVGALTNRQNRSIDINFSFLDPVKKYRITQYADRKETHFLNNKEAYQVIEPKNWNQKDLRIHLAPGGGQTLHIQELNPSH